MRAFCKIVNNPLNEVYPAPTAAELAGYSEQMLPVAQIAEINGEEIVIEGGSVEALMYAQNFLGVRRVILVTLTVK